MKNVISWWTHNHVAANLLMLAIFIAGFIGFGKMEREIFPTFAYPGLQVTVVWQGASPQEVEKQIISRIEESIKDLDDIDFIQSVAREGTAEVRVLAERSENFSDLSSQIKNRVDSISSFPSDIEQPIITQFYTDMEVVRLALYGDVGENQLTQIATNLQREMLGLSHVNKVNLFGNREREISIEVSELNLKRYGLSFDQIATAIRKDSINLSAGNLETSAGNYTLRAHNLADSQQQLADIVLKQTESGATLRLGDIATIDDGFEENEILATFNGKPAILLQVMSTETMDIIDTSNSVNQWLETKQDKLPTGVGLSLWTDMSDTFSSRISSISTAALSGLLLVFIVLMLTLRPMVAIWVTLGIATAFAGTFIFLDSTGTSLNMLSTFAFLLVLGVVVDDAIIVGESVHRQFEEGNSGNAGATAGTQRVLLPVFFGVATTIIAFLPWLFLSGPTQVFTMQIAWVVIFALSFSLIEAMWILPAHLSTMKPYNHKHFFGQFQHKIAQSIITFSHRRYSPILQKSLRHPWLVSSIFAGVLVICFVGLLGPGHIRTSFNPGVESEEIFINIELREGTTFDQALQILLQMQEAQQQLIAEVEEQFPDGKIVENWYTRSRKDSVIAIVKLASPEIRSMSAKAAALRLRELIGEVPNARSIQVRYSIDGSGPDLQFSIQHHDLEVLSEAVRAFSRQLENYPAVYDVSNSIESTREEIVFDLKPGVEKLGLTIADVIRQVRQSYHGEEIQRIPRQGSDVRMVLRYPKSLRQSLESINQLRIRTADGREVALPSIANIRYQPGLKQIDRLDGKRSVEIRAYLKEPIREQIIEDLNTNFFEKWEQRYYGVERKLTGNAEAEQEFQQEISNLIIMALFAMFTMLAVAFKSYSQPLLVLIAIPFAAMGAMFGHLLNNMPVTLYSYFGIVAASGVVINDNLVLIDYYNRLRSNGATIKHAIVEAATTRFRPILVTSLTTFIGLVPMMLERSTQSAFLQPIVISLTYGVVMAFFVTLFFVPTLLIIGDQYSCLVTRIKKGTKEFFSSSNAG